MNLTLKRRMRDAGEVATNPAALFDASYEHEQAREAAFKVGYDAAITDDPNQWYLYAGTLFESQYLLGYRAGLADLRDGSAVERAPLVLVETGYLGRHRVSA